MANSFRLSTKNGFYEIIIIHLWAASAGNLILMWQCKQIMPMVGCTMFAGLKMDVKMRFFFNTFMKL